MDDGIVHIIHYDIVDINNQDVLRIANQNAGTVAEVDPACHDYYYYYLLRQSKLVTLHSITTNHESIRQTSVQ